jgi:hypothetical protein
MNHKHEALWLLKRCTLYILCTLILSKFLHLTIGSSSILIQNELWVPISCHAHSKVFFLMFKVSKKCHQSFNLLVYCTLVIFVIHHFFGWKVAHPPIMCFHPFVECFGFSTCFLFIYLFSIFFFLCSMY